MWSKIAFVAPLIFNLLIVKFEPSWLQIAAAFSKYDLSQTSFPSFPFNFYFVTFSSGSLVGLGFDSHDNAPGFNGVF